MESAFKILFFIAIIVFCLFIVGLFLLIVKILLLFYPNVAIMGLVIMPY